jgi:hypothetical protein
MKATKGRVPQINRPDGDCDGFLCSCAFGLVRDTRKRQARRLSYAGRDTRKGQARRLSYAGRDTRKGQARRLS